MLDRPVGLNRIACDQDNIPFNERYEYDDSEGLNTIVNNVLIEFFALDYL